MAAPHKNDAFWQTIRSALGTMQKNSRENTE